MRDAYRARGGSLSNNPRRVALAVLRATQEGAAPEDVLNRDGVMLSQRDRALASALVYNCLRHQSRLDFLLDRKLSQPSGTPSLVRIILRLGLSQLLFFDRLANHAVVNETAELAKKFAPGREGLVNAILRSFIADKEEGPYWPVEEDGAQTPIARRLSVFYSYPQWLVDKLLDEWGFQETRSFLVAGNASVPPTLRVNTQLITREELMELLPFKTNPTKYSPWGLAPEGFTGHPDTWPGYHEGYFSIQDEASQVAGLLYGSATRFLDVCAGLGGKSLSFKSLNPESYVLAMDINDKKLSRTKEEATRLKLEGQIDTKVGDALIEKFSPSFDLIYLDPPCTGLGVIRRRPDVKWKKREEDISTLASLQRSLLNSAARALVPGGRLIYSVCTVTHEEGPQVVMDFIEESGDFTLVNDFPPSLSDANFAYGMLRFLPHRHGTDGFFYALLERRGS
ncbi:MAG: 16S rRNA (cytosine(967)-C(5))-methyltransferase RsmB [Deltaproteobacteria bacterium]|jgi:16S rRNA (cytosine967-C5)-methyltransferase|nr:16S rRNA (cytosine(967)-C(5))-methyltransferase RsmB [Deltaproteobacteria bacterium]